MLARTLGFPPVPAEKADATGRPGRIGAAGLPRGAVPLVAGLLCALATLALLLGPLPPLTDLPGHLARVDIVDRLPASPFLAVHWRTDWLVANLLFDAVAVPLSRLVPVTLAAKLYVALVAALLVSGCVALHRAYH